MAVELLTGHKGTVNHITAKNGRWMNRATYGNGNYMLVGENGKSGNYDYDYPRCTADTVTGGYMPTVHEGLILWNGMFIYVTSNTTPSEAISSCDGWKIYLHYTKASNIESVEIVFTNDDSSFASKIKTNAEFTDSLSEAYVLYAEYSTTSRKFEHAFEKKKSSTALIQALSDSLDTTNTAVAGKLNTSDYTADQATRETTINNNIAKKVSLTPFNVGLAGTDYDRVQLGSVTIQPCSTEAVGTLRTGTLSESISNFAFIEIRTNTSYLNSIAIIPTFMLLSSGGTSAWGGSSSEYICLKKWSKVGSGGGIFELHTCIYAYGTSISAYDYRQYKNGAFSAGTSNKTLYIYGIGRVAS